MVELISENGQRFRVHPKFWQGALYVAEEFGGWRPRMSISGQFLRDSNTWHLAKALQRVNRQAYGALAKFLQNHKGIQIC